MKPYIADNRRRDRQAAAAAAAANENYIYLKLIREAGWRWYSSWSAGQEAKEWHIYHPCIRRGEEIQHVSLEVAATKAMHAMHQQLDCHQQPKPQAPPTGPLWPKRLKYYADEAMPHILTCTVWFCFWAVEYLMREEAA